MKKQILTFAVLGAVAIGGAVSQVSAGTYYTDNQTRYVCEGGDISCSDAMNNQNAWDNLADVGKPELIVNPSVYENEEFQD